MEVSGSVISDLASMVDTATRDSGLEMEARVLPSERSLNRRGFERLVRYLGRTVGGSSPPSLTLDISMGHYRLTVEGADAVSELCCASSEIESLRALAGRGDAYAIRKEPARSKVSLTEYNSIVSLKWEMSMPDFSDALSALSGPRRLRHYRLKRRHSFVSADSCFRFDCTVVKSAAGARSVLGLAGAPETFEVEVEYTGAPLDSKSPLDATGVAKAMVSHIGEVLMVLRDQRDGDVMTTTQASAVMSEIARLAGGGAGWHHRRLMHKSVTLERANLLAETDDTFSVTGDGALRYTVTDKADGERALLFVDSKGNGFLLSDRDSVRRTGISGAPAAVRNSLLDGEHVTTSRAGTAMDLFLVFDVYWAGGEDVRRLPLVDLDGGEQVKGTRMGSLSGAAWRAISGSTPSVRAKVFHPVPAAPDVYARSMSAAEYAVDGLVLTPERLGVFQDRPGAPPSGARGSTWHRVFKWKPPKDNSVDFKVIYEKTSAGDIAFSGGATRARLMVGSRDVGIGADPYKILTNAPVDSRSLLQQFDAPSYGASGALSPLGLLVTSGREVPLCSQPPNEPVIDESVVEFTWGGGRWVPLRVRHDKTFPNSIDTAVGVWRSICFPVDVDDIRDPSRVAALGAEAKDDVYFEQASGDGGASEPMRRFHRSWIIDGMLLARAAAYVGGKNIRLLDIACGRGADMNSWIRNGYTVVVGVDIFEDNLVSKSKAGAYARLARLRGTKPNANLRYAFVPMDAGARIGREAVDAIANPSLKKIAQALWRRGKDPALSAYDGLATIPFDVVSCQFAAHYMFETEEKLDAFVGNVADNLKVSGLFVGTCTDGAATDAALAAAEAAGETSIRGVGEDGGTVWRIERREGGKAAGAYGRGIAVYVETINKVNVEYLADFGVLTSKLASRGLHLLDKGELKKFGIASSSALFSDAYSDVDWLSLSRDTSNPKRAALAAEIGGMSPDLRRFSFLNRYFVFIKRATGTGA